MRAPVSFLGGPPHFFFRFSDRAGWVLYHEK